MVTHEVIISFMVKDKQKDEGTILAIILLGIVITLVFIGLIIFFMIKTQNNEICGQDTDTFYTGLETTNSSYTLLNSQSYVLQNHNINGTAAIKYTFCASTYVGGQLGLELEVIDKFNNTLGVGYVNNESTSFCAELNNEFITDDNYLGVRCPTCTASNNITLQSEITGDEVNQIYFDGTDTNVTSSETLDYELIMGGSCKQMIQFFTNWYFVLLFFLGVAILILVGYTALKERFFEGKGGGGDLFD